MDANKMKQHKIIKSKKQVWEIRRSVKKAVCIKDVLKSGQCAVHSDVASYFMI